MSKQYDLTLRFQTYYNERVRLSVAADTEEEAIIAAKTHAKEHWLDGTLDKDIEPLTKKPRFYVEGCVDVGDQGVKTPATDEETVEM